MANILHNHTEMSYFHQCSLIVFHYLWFPSGSLDYITVSVDMTCVKPSACRSGVSTMRCPLRFFIFSSLLLHSLSSLIYISIPPLSALASGCWHWLSNTCAVGSITLNSHKLVREQSRSWWEQHMYTGVIIYLQSLLQTEILWGTVPGIQILAVSVDSR